MRTIPTHCQTLPCASNGRTKVTDVSARPQLCGWLLLAHGFSHVPGHRGHTRSGHRITTNMMLFTWSLLVSPEFDVKQRETFLFGQGCPFFIWEGTTPDNICSKKA